MSAAGDKLREWRTDPILFVTEVFGITPDAWQIDTLKLIGGDFNPRRRVCMKACTGPGKSAVLAWAGWHRLACFADKGQHPKGAALSGEGRDNLRDNLWAELSKWRERSDFLKATFTWTAERIASTESPDTWFLSARSYAKDADSEAIGRSISGLHSQFPFILLDEVGDAPNALGQKAEQIFTGDLRDGLVICAGNPTSTNGLLYNICTNLAHLWQIITITADPDDPKRTPRVDVEHAREQINTYGRDNPWVKATILGQFPPSSINALLGPDDVHAAMRRQVKHDDYAFSQKRMGVDVARFGLDSTVLFPRQGLMSFKPTVLRNLRTNDIAARIASEKVQQQIEVEFIDDTGGFGAGVIDSMIQAGLAPLPVNFAGKSIDPRFLNKRAEMWFLMSEWVKKGGSLPDVPELVRELTAPTYTFQNGKFKLEEKEQIKDRLGHSTDLGDALALTFALPDQPASTSLHAIAYGQTNKLKWDYDPFQHDSK